MEVLRRAPRDRDAERACLGAQLCPRPAPSVDPRSYWWPVHGAIQEALLQLVDIGPFTLAGYEEWIDLWPITPPSSVRVRCAAVWTMVDEYAVGEVRLENLWMLVECADGMAARAADTVQARADDRKRILQLEDELAALAESA